MQNLPFDKAGRFWRGNLHTHSTRSDGRLSPAEVCRLYRENGYDFVAITDHFLAHYDYPMTDTHPFRAADFTTLIGAELHTGVTELGYLWHILAVGLPLDFAPPTPVETGPQIAARALAAGAFVAVPHPHWNNVTEADVLSLGDIHAVEIYNATVADHNDSADTAYMLDLMLARGKRLTACATDDAHFSDRGNDALRGWVYVKSETLEAEALLTALKAGHYYASTGPQIFDIQVMPKDKVYVRCSPAERVFVIGKGPDSQGLSRPYYVNVHGSRIMEAELPLHKFNSPYGRVIVRDPDGKRAWSNPFWFV